MTRRQLGAEQRDWYSWGKWKTTWSSIIFIPQDLTTIESAHVCLAASFSRSLAKYRRWWYVDATELCLSQYRLTKVPINKRHLYDCKQDSRISGGIARIRRSAPGSSQQTEYQQQKSVGIQTSFLKPNFRKLEVGFNFQLPTPRS